MSEKKKCFIIMPITTPKQFVELYKGDTEHFKHVLEILFKPAIEKAGFEPISPEASGSEIIHANIINNLATCDLVLCDMSILNPNVFFELGIRTALNKPVAMVVDDRYKDKTPFDTKIIHCSDYNGSLNAWDNDKEIEKITKHIKSCFKKSEDYNSLWKYFGISTTGEYDPNASTTKEKLDFIIKLLQNSNISSRAYTNVGKLVKAISEGYYNRPYLNLNNSEPVTKDLFSEQEITNRIKMLRWICPNCGKLIEEGIDSCSCGFVRDK